MLRNERTATIAAVAFIKDFGAGKSAIDPVILCATDEVAQIRCSIGTDKEHRAEIGVHRFVPLVTAVRTIKDAAIGHSVKSFSAR